MYPWQSSSISYDSPGLFRRVIAYTVTIGTLIGGAVTGLQEIDKISDWANKTTEWVKMTIFPVSALDHVIRDYDAQASSLCTSAKYTELFKVSPCFVTDISDQQTSSTTQVTPLIAAQLHDFSTERTVISNLLIGGCRKYGDAKDRAYASVLADNELARLKSVQDLIEKRINLGQFNSQRLRIYKEDKKSMDLLKIKHRDN